MGQRATTDLQTVQNLGVVKKMKDAHDRVYPELIYSVMGIKIGPEAHSGWASGPSLIFQTVYSFQELTQK